MVTVMGERSYRNQTAGSESSVCDVALAYSVTEYWLVTTLRPAHPHCRLAGNRGDFKGFDQNMSFRFSCSLTPTIFHSNSLSRSASFGMESAMYIRTVQSPVLSGHDLYEVLNRPGLFAHDNPLHACAAS